MLKRGPPSGQIIYFVPDVPSKSTPASCNDNKLDIVLKLVYPATAMAPMTRSHELIPRSEGMPLSRQNFREASWQYVGVCVLLGASYLTNINVGIHSPKRDLTEKCLKSHLLPTMRRQT